MARPDIHLTENAPREKPTEVSKFKAAWAINVATFLAEKQRRLLSAADPIRFPAVLLHSKAKVQARHTALKIPQRPPPPSKYAYRASR